MPAVKCDWCGEVHPEDKGICFAFDQILTRDEVMVYIELGMRVGWFIFGQHFMVTYQDA